MPIISVFNNKGGVGKSTVTIGLAEFLSGHQGKRTLVVDLDSQASTSGSLVGRKAISTAIAEQRTTVDLMAALKTPARRTLNLADFVVTRPAVDGPRFSLGQIDLLVPNKPRQVDFEEDEMGSRKSLTLMRDRLKHQLLQDYDYVLVDHPGNLDRRQKFAWNGLAMSDFVIIPILPTEMTVAATPDTLEILEQVRESTDDVRRLYSPSSRTRPTIGLNRRRSTASSLPKLRPRVTCRRSWKRSGPPVRRCRRCRTSG